MELHSCGACNNKSFTSSDGCKERVGSSRQCYQGNLLEEVMIKFYPESRVGVLLGEYVEKGNSVQKKVCAQKPMAEMVCCEGGSP